MKKKEKKLAIKSLKDHFSKKVFKNMEIFEGEDNSGVKALLANNDDVGPNGLYMCYYPIGTKFPKKLRKEYAKDMLVDPNEWPGWWLNQENMNPAW